MSATLPKDLRKLDDFLLSEAVSEDAMLLSELDGFLAGVIVCPDLILPSEWLPVVWADEEPVYDSPQQAEVINGLVMNRYNDIIRQLDQRRYRPIYDIDTDDSALWETWMEGFRAVMFLRPGAWSTFGDLHEADEDVQQALFVLMRLADLALPGAELEPMSVDEELQRLAPDLIPEYVQILHHARLANGAATSSSMPKVGRNEPCPCGSGKKFKKCCLQ